MKKIAAIFAAVLFLTGCAKVKEGASAYYLAKARKALSAQDPSPAELEKAYSALGTSLSLMPSSPDALETLRGLTQKSFKAGFAGGAELEIVILKRVLRRDVYNWPAYAALMNSLSVRGDLYSLNELAARLEAAGAAPGNSQPYETAAALALCYAALAPWVESEGYLSLNKDAETLIEKAREYSRVRRRAEELQGVLEKMEAGDPSLRKKAPGALLSSAEVALEDLAAGRDEAQRIYASTAKLDSEPDFLKAAALTVRGNSVLVKKDYPGARALYQSALQTWPGFIDARKQLVEVDFQEGAGLAASGASVPAAKVLLSRAYEESDAVLEIALEKPNWLPFMTRDKFLADTYAVRAAAIAAIRAIEKDRLRNGRKLEKEFRSALDEAVRLNPQGKLARDLLERYSKEGF